jgi:hypothetical protein
VAFFLATVKKLKPACAKILEKGNLRPAHDAGTVNARSGRYAPIHEPDPKNSPWLDLVDLRLRRPPRCPLG